MHRRFGWVLLVALGIVLGSLSSPYQRINADPPKPASDSSDPNDSEAVAQLRQINAQLREINTMLQTGTAKVTVAAGIINPGRP